VEGKDIIKKVAIFIAIMHPIEALIARRMAKKRGKNPTLYFFLTLFTGFPVMLRLRKIKPVEETA
jgi:hypothetical protein